MKTRLLLASLMLLPVGSACGSSQQGPVKWAEPLNQVAITTQDVKKLEAEALSGSPESANRLSVHYLIATNDIVKREYWTQIAAENGHPVGQFNFAKILLSKGDELSSKRAEYWLSRSAKNGNRRAVELLNEAMKKSGKAKEKAKDTH